MMIVPVCADVMALSIEHEGGDPCGCTNADLELVSEEYLFDIEIGSVDLAQKDGSLRKAVEAKAALLGCNLSGFHRIWVEPDEDDENNRLYV